MVFFPRLNRVGKRLVVTRTTTCLRNLSVKELSWCAPKASPHRQATVATPENSGNENNNAITNNDTGIDPFGIVAAMSRNRIIGVNGSIPWPRCAADRDNFRELTQNKLLILGRRTFQEDPNLRHISHTKWCLVVSTSITDSSQLQPNPRDKAPHTHVHVVASFPEALVLAKILLQEHNKDTATHHHHDDQVHEDDGSHDLSAQGIPCWVAGGERIYEEALQHPSAQQVHLTTLHLDIPVTAQQPFAVFPAKHRWDRPFQQVSRVEGGGPTEQQPDSPSFTYATYIRKEKV